MPSHRKARQKQRAATVWVLPVFFRRLTSSQISSRTSKPCRAAAGRRHATYLARGVCLAVLWLWALDGVAEPADLAEIQALADSGAPALALRVLDRYQPDASADQAAWIEWERQRVGVLQSSRDWQTLAQRLAALPIDLPDEFMTWAATQRAEALVHLGQTVEARQVLQGLIWSPFEVSAEDLAHWRRLVIHSYMIDNAMQDARTAVVRFRQDYGDGEIDDVLLRARILLMSDRPLEAAQILAAHTDKPAAGTMLLLAQLRGGQRTPRKVLQAALRQMRGEWADDALTAQLWAVAAEAADEAGDRASRTNALEQVLMRRQSDSLPDGLFAYSGDSLWQAYLDYGLYVGNREQFLIGNDPPWLAAADKAAKTTPVMARALNAVVLHRGTTAENRATAARAFLQTLEDQEHGGVLLSELFLDSTHYPSPDQVPVLVRHALVDVALADSRINDASRLMATMQEPPAGTDNFMWHLRRARILVLGGQPQQGTAALMALLEGEQALEKEQLDRFMQVVFDLQTVGDHDEAYALFDTVFQQSQDDELRREVLYWMADSRKAQDKFDEAARLYLKSAMLLDAKAQDPWAQTARYQAAESLAKAGLQNDARDLFQQLLKTTEDPSRRAVLNREIQRLWLIDAASTP